MVGTYGRGTIHSSHSHQESKERERKVPKFGVSSQLPRQIKKWQNLQGCIKPSRVLEDAGPCVTLLATYPQSQLFSKSLSCGISSLNICSRSLLEHGTERSLHVVFFLSSMNETLLLKVNIWNCLSTFAKTVVLELSITQTFITHFLLLLSLLQRPIFPNVIVFLNMPPSNNITKSLYKDQLFWFNVRKVASKSSVRNNYCMVFIHTEMFYI